jgi:hypothetical protein
MPKQFDGSTALAVRAELVREAKERVAEYADYYRCDAHLAWKLAYADVRRQFVERIEVWESEAGWDPNP